MYLFPIINEHFFQVHRLSLKKEMTIKKPTGQNGKHEQFLTMKDSDNIQKKYSLFYPDYLPLSIAYYLSRSSNHYFLRGRTDDYLIPSPQFVFQKNIYSMLLNQFYYEMIYDTADPYAREDYFDLQKISRFDGMISHYLTELETKEISLLMQQSKEGEKEEDKIPMEQYLSLLKVLDTTLVTETPIFRVTKKNQEEVVGIAPTWTRYYTLAKRNAEMLKQIEKYNMEQQRTAENEIKKPLEFSLKMRGVR